MKGDFSRIRFNPAKQYTAVIEQQGRVALDADANEQSAILGYLSRKTNTDVIGQYGGPVGDAGFAIKIEGADIWIGPGRYYVDGLMVENPHWLRYDEQPYLIHPTYSSKDLLEAVYTGKGGVTAQLVLQVWQRLVTALDDPCLLEPALVNADTTVRLQTVWRVVGSVNNLGGLVDFNPTISKSAASPAVAPGEKIDATSNSPLGDLSSCCQSLYHGVTPTRTGAMGAGLSGSGSDCGCQPIASAGYQGLENQLYRVEIHSGGTLDTATFKWSRENGSVVSQVTFVSGKTITVSSLGPDANLGFQPGQWVELSDDTNLFGQPPNQAGTLFQIYSVQQATLQVTLTTAVTGLDTTKNARMRRWDQSGASATVQGVALSATSVPLENGIEVSFRKGTYLPGDYWMIPARAASGEIDWPPCGGDGKFFQPAAFSAISNAPVACIHARSLNRYEEDLYKVSSADEYVPQFFTVDDCRLLFPPLIALNETPTNAALHVSAVSWTNDDIMTVDTFLQKGFWVTFDQATTCPWGGGNFQVSLELPNSGDQFAAIAGKFPGLPAPTFSAPPGTDVFGRTVVALDPPWGVDVSGATVNWIAPVATKGVASYGPIAIYELLNVALFWNAFKGFGRVRVRLIGGAVYADGASGRLYLDGQSLGQTGSRAVDGSECVNLTEPSGTSQTASDYESWFYLAPTVVIASIAIQLLDNANIVGSNAVTVNVNYTGAMTGLQTTANPAVAVTAVRAVVTLTYPPVTQTVVTLSLTGPGAGSVATIQATETIAAGQVSVNVPISILNSPGVNAKGTGNVDTVTLSASVAGLFSTIPFGGTAPTLVITGGQIPPEPIQ